MTICLNQGIIVHYLLLALAFAFAIIFVKALFVLGQGALKGLKHLYKKKK